jgi:hypothetical protein
MMPFRLRHADKLAASFIAAVTVIVLVVLFLVIKGQNLFQGREAFYTVFEEGGGIAPETPVKIAGIEVGQVRAVSLTEANKVRVDFEVLEQFADRVRADPPYIDCEGVAAEMAERCGFAGFAAPEPEPSGPVQKSCETLEYERHQCGSRVKVALPGGLGAFLPGGGGLIITVGNMQNDRVASGGLVPSEKAKGLNDILADLAQQGVVQNAQDIVDQIAILLRRVNDAEGPIWESIENVRTVTSRVKEGQGVVGQALTPGSKMEKQLQKAYESLNRSLLFVEQAANQLKQITVKADTDMARLSEAIKNMEEFSVHAKAAAADLRQFSEDAMDVPPDMSDAIKNLDGRIDDLGDIIRGLKKSFPLNLIVDESDRPDKGVRGTRVRVRAAPAKDAGPAPAERAPAQPDGTDSDGADGAEVTP